MRKIKSQNTQNTEEEKMTEEEALCFAIEMMEELIDASNGDEEEIDTHLSLHDCVNTLEELRTKVASL